MSFWPGKGLFSSRNKRHQQRIRVVWRPPEKSNENAADKNEEQPERGETQSKVLKQKDNPKKSCKQDEGDQKKTSKYEKDNSRGKKRRNVKSVIDQSSNSGSEKLASKSADGENADDDETVDERGLSETSNDVPVTKKKSRKKRSTRSKKSVVVLDPIVKKDEQDTKLKVNKYHDVGSSDDHYKRLDDWEDAGDSGGRISRCSSSSSLSSSCSHHSLIKHYTNIMMNCCDDQFDEDCNVVKNKIDRILKSQWKDRLNRSKEKTSGASESHSPTPQTSLKNASTFKLRPARLPLNKKTWSKLKKSNQNTDWLFQNDS